MCTGWNKTLVDVKKPSIITYWEMCTGWNMLAIIAASAIDYNLLGNVHWLEPARDH